VAAALERTAQLPYERAWSMPSELYTDPAILALERERLFRQEWLCVGRREEVARPGDYMALELCDEPVVVIHGLDGVLRAFSNVCRHRGMPVARGKGHGKGLMCPYHHWTYDTAGRLMSTPRLGTRPDFDAAACALPRLALEQWQGFLFVSLAEDPAPLAPRLAELERIVRPYHLELNEVRYLADEVWATNWKNLLENFMEGYHLSALHHDTLHNVNPTRLCRHLPPGDAYFGYFAGFNPELPRVQKGHPDLTDQEREDCVMFAVPPGFAVGCSADYSSFMCIQPESVDRVRMKLGLIFYGSEWPPQSVERAVELYQQTMAEDKTILVGLAKGLRSRYYERGPLAGPALEGPVWDFYRYLNRTLGPGLR
jgi:phenylpropionate dioxygenase-like ring-hydroxylating dioxygenase large terminal subunit